MAGTRDTPEEKAQREAIIEAENHVEVASAVPVYGRRIGKDEQNAVVASAARINLNDRRSIANTRQRRQAWQSEAWDYYDEIGELGYTVDFTGNLLSKIRLYVAAKPDAKAGPVPVGDPESGIDETTARTAEETLELLRSRQGGQSALVREISINFDVAGEAYLHGTTDTETNEEDWQVRSVDELVVTESRFTLRSAPGYNNQAAPISDEDVVIRLWERHARFSELATSPMRRVLGEAESLLLLSREIRATSKSRLSNGILLIPQEMSFGPIDPTRDQGDGETGDDPFDASLQESMVMPIQQEGSASAVVPLTLRGPAELLDKVRHLKLERPIDAALDARIEGRILRLARGMNMPVEVLTGLQETTFANAAQVKKSEWDAHGEPRAVLICDALTAGYLQPALEEAGVSRDQALELFIWFDPSDAIASPDPADNAEGAHKDGVISDEARRRTQGFSEGDKPDDLEALRKWMKDTRIGDPFLLAQLLRISGLAPDIEVPAPAAGTIDNPPEPLPEEEGSITAAAAARRGSAALGRRLTAMDRELRTRLRVGADAALKRALEKAGSKIRTKATREKNEPVARVIDSVSDSKIVAAALGPSIVAALGFSDQELIGRAFDDFGKSFDTWVEKTQTAAVSEVRKTFQIDADDAKDAALQQRQAEARSRAWSVLQPKLVDIGIKKLYGQSEQLVAAGADDVEYDVPMDVIREAMGIAGGAQVTVGAGGSVSTADGEASPGVATGPLALTETGGVEGYQWVHGGAAHPLQAHVELDGTTFVYFDDDALANNDSFPETDFLYPGDHNGCTCDVTPVILGPEEGAVTNVVNEEGDIVAE